MKGTPFLQPDKIVKNLINLNPVSKIQTNEKICLLCETFYPNIIKAQIKVTEVLIYVLFGRQLRGVRTS